MSAKFFKSRKAAAESTSNASGAAFLILLITVILVFYLLFLPPAERAAILEDQAVPGTPHSSSSGYAQLIGTTPLNEHVGYIDYVKDDDIVHELSTFTIFTTKDAGLIASIGSLYVKNSAFEKKSQEMRFSIDPFATENVKLSFNVFRATGALKVYLNGIIIFEGEVAGSPAPIILPKNLLKQDNILFFTASSPGFAFWSVHQYELQNIIVTGDITDSSNNFNMQKVYIAESEYDHLKTATLQFFPDCSNTNVGKMTVKINNQQVFKGIPDCGLKNFISLDKSILEQGENKIEFVSDAGSYIIDMVELESKLEDAQYPLYYFDLNEDLFTTAAVDAFCGKVDGVCPNNCEAYEDKDCCFEESSRNLWCDMKTDNPRDRCVNMILASQGDNCLSGYEDRSGNPPDGLEGACGDDTDGFCPADCNYQYDKDCCFTIDNAFWCDDIPFTGRDSVCTTSVTPSECDACPDNYYDVDNRRPNCPVQNDTTSSSSDEKELKAGVNVLFKAYFANQDYKRVDFIINGKKLPVDTYNMLVQRNINSFVREGTNSVEVQPRRDIAIAQIKVVIE